MKRIYGGSVLAPASASAVTSQACCKHFFRCLDTDGYMRDHVGGVVWSPASAGFTLSYDATLQALSTDMTSADLAVALVSGSFGQWGANSAAMAVVAGRITDYSKVRFSLGTNAVDVGQGTRSYGMDAAGYFHSVIGSLDGTTYNRLSNAATIDSTAQGKDIVMLNQYLPGSGITLFEMYDLASARLINATVSDGATTGTGISPFQPNAYMRFSGLKAYGAAYFEFTSGVLPPLGIVDALAMGAMWRDKKRYLHPTWNNL